MTLDSALTELGRTLCSLALRTAQVYLVPGLGHLALVAVVHLVMPMPLEQPHVGFLWLLHLGMWSWRLSAEAWDTQARGESLSCMLADQLHHFSFTAVF